MERTRLAARILALLPAGCSLVAMAGWILGIDALTWVLPDMPVTTFNTALGMLLSALAVGLLTPAAGRTARMWGRAAAVGAATLGGVTLAQYAFGIDLGIDELFIADPDAPSDLPGRPSPQTALTLLLLGAGMLVGEGPRRLHAAVSRVLLIGALAVPLLALHTYFYAIGSAVELAPIIGPGERVPYTGMALLTMTGLLGASLGALISRRSPLLGSWLDDAGITGVVLRRGLLWLVVGTPVALGGLLMLGRLSGLYGVFVQAALFGAFWTLGGWWALVLLVAVVERLEAEVARSEAWLRSVLTGAADAIVIVDAHGVIRFASDHVQALFGHRPEELVGQSVEMLVPEELLEAHREHRARFLSEGRARRMAADRPRLVARTASGGRRAVEVSLSPLQTPDGPMITAIVRDVTDRRRAAEERERLLAEVQRARARLRTVIDHAPVGILVVARDDGVQLANHVAASLFEALPSAAHDVEARFRDRSGRPLPAETGPLARLRTGEALKDEAYRLWRPDGSTVPVRVCGAPVPEAEGPPQGDCLTVDDASLQEQLDDVRADYMALLSHDLKSPLGAITLAAEVLRRHPGPEQLQKMPGVISDNARRVLDMVEELNDVARLEAASPALRVAPLDLQPYLRGLLARLHPGDERISVEVAPETPPMLADPARLEQIVGNLVGNALKYGGPGPITVRVEPDGALVRLTVEDRGPGIPPDDLPHVFDKHYRARAHRATHTGLGMGLYSARLLVEAHGGTVHAESEQGRGTRFVVRIPAATPATV